MPINVLTPPAFRPRVQYRGTSGDMLRFALQRNSGPNPMSLPTRASQCRRNAYYCRMLAIDAISTADRVCLMTMQRAWLALAENEDWLNGVATGEISPGAIRHGPHITHPKI